MIASSNGLATRKGLSGQLGGDEDKALFRTLRSLSDFILVGLRTVHDEQYKPPRLTEEEIEERKLSGKRLLPRITVVSNSLKINRETPLFSSDTYSPTLLTSESSRDAEKTKLLERYEIISAGKERVDFREGIDKLTMQRGQIVLVEGGPSINKQLVAADLFDELCITFSPFYSDDLDSAIVTTDKSYPSGHFEEVRKIEINGFTFSRYLRNRGIQKSLANR
jgi:riboflavin biosynthesis pyrimidine reductase